MINQIFKCLSPSDSSMQVLLKNIVKTLGTLASVASFFRHCVINVEEKRLKQEPQASKKILTHPGHSSSVSTGTTLEDMLRACRSCCKRHDCKNRKYRNTPEELRETRRKARRPRPFYIADNRPKPSKSKSPDSSLRSHMKCTDFTRQNCDARRRKEKL